MSTVSVRSTLVTITNSTPAASLAVSRSPSPAPPRRSSPGVGGSGGPSRETLLAGDAGVETTGEWESYLRPSTTIASNRWMRSVPLARSLRERSLEAGRWIRLSDRAAVRSGV